MTIEHIKLITTTSNTAVSNLIKPYDPEFERVEHSRYYLGLPYSCYFTAMSASTKLQYPSAQVMADGKSVFLQPSSLLPAEATAGFIKRPSLTGIPTQFTLAIAAMPNSTNNENWAVHQFSIEATRKAVENFVTNRHEEITYVQQSGIPIKDLSPAFRQAAQAIDPSAQVMMAACHLQLLNGKYYAHIGSVGNNMVIVLGADGSIKYQTGATTYLTTVQSRNFPNLVQHTMPLETGDIILLLSNSAWSSLDKAEQYAVGNYRFKDTNQNSITAQVHMKNTHLKSDALRQLKCHCGNLAQANSALSSIILEQAKIDSHTQNESLKNSLMAIKRIVEILPTRINVFIDTLPICDKTLLKEYLLSKYFNLDQPGQFYKLWEAYHPDITSDGPAEIWKYLPFCQENTDAFLSELERYSETKFVVSLLRALYHTPIRDSSSAMMLVVPDFKTEIIRSWIENDDDMVRGNLLKLMIDKNITLQDLDAAVKTFEAEVYALPAESGIYYSSREPLNLIKRYPNLNNSLQISYIREYITFATQLLQFPRPLDFQQIISMSFRGRINEYTQNAEEFITICITDGGLLKSAEIATVATKALVKHCQEQLLPRLLQEAHQYINRPDLKNEYTLQLLVDDLLIMRNESPFNIVLQSSTTWKPRKKEKRSPSQIVIDEMITTLSAELKLLRDKVIGSVSYQVYQLSKY